MLCQANKNLQSFLLLLVQLCYSTKGNKFALMYSVVVNGVSVWTNMCFSSLFHAKFLDRYFPKVQSCHCFRMQSVCMSHFFL